MLGRPSAKSSGEVLTTAKGRLGSQRRLTDVRYHNGPIREPVTIWEGTNRNRIGARLATVRKFETLQFFEVPAPTPVTAEPKAG
jgi:hypothetical protein